MPPVMNRQGSNERAEKAWRLHIAGRTWRNIAEETGYRSPQSAQKAATSWLKKNPQDDLETMRRATGDGIRLVRSWLYEAMEAAKDAGKYQTVSELGRGILDSYEKEAKLWGTHIVVPTEVNINVQSMAEILTDTRARLMAAIASTPAPEIVDAEVVAIES